MTAVRAGSDVWVAVCPLARLPHERGVAAIVGGIQVAIFRTFDDEVYATGNQDPFSGAHVLARGIVGTRAGVPIVISPLHKQAFDLQTGACVDDPTVRIPVYRLRVREGVVEIAEASR